MQLRRPLPKRRRQQAQNGKVPGLKATKSGVNEPEINSVIEHGVCACNALPWRSWEGLGYQYQGHRLRYQK